MGRPVDNGPPGRDEFLIHLAIAMKDNEDLEAIKLRRSANRKRTKAAGIELGDLDFTIKVMGWAPSEIATFFSRKFAYLGYAAIQIGTQFDLFTGQTPAAKGAVDVRSLGLAAGLKGQDGTPPPNLKGAEAQQWMEGWHEGQRALVAGMERRSEAAAQSAPPAPAETVSDELVLKVTDFPGCAELEDCSKDAYRGTADWADFKRVVVTDAGENDEVVLKDVDKGIGVDDAEFETPAEDLAKQSPRKAAAAKREGATT